MPKELISDTDFARLKNALGVQPYERGRGCIVDENRALDLVKREEEARLHIDWLQDEHARKLRGTYWQGYFMGMAVTMFVIAAYLTLAKVAKADDVIRFYPSPAQFEAATRVAWGEMRSGSDMEIAGVCHVMLNRMLIEHRGKKDIQAVAHAPRQFSAFNVDDVNRAKLLRPALTKTRSYKRVAAICRTSIAGRLEGWIDDITFGSDHYWNGRDPWWITSAKGKLKITTIGKTHFVKLCKSKRTRNLRRDVDQIGALIRNLEKAP